MWANSAKRQWVVAALIAAILAATLPALAAYHARLPSLPPPAAENTPIPAALLPRVNASFAADDPAYAIAALPDEATTLRAANPAHHLMTTFASDGVTFAGKDDARWSLRLSDIKADTAPIIAGGRVEYRRGNLTEWYLNGPLGVEQGFTLTAPPASGDAFALTVATGGNATPRLDGGDVTLTLPDGEEWTYGHLLVTDATGRQLPARMDVERETIAIHTDLAGAVYPVTVDPLVQQKRLTASDGADSDFFGTAVAMSGDGTRVIVGAYFKGVGVNSRQGEAYVYSGTNYATEKKLTASDGATDDYFGGAVAISTDGTRVVVGAYFMNVGMNPRQGAAYVYSGTNYATEKKLTASDGMADDNFGRTVGMSGDGTRVITGAPSSFFQTNSQGAAYIYNGVNYATEKKLVASDHAAGDAFGTAVAMSGDGTKVIVGAIGKQVGGNPQQGAAYIYSGTNYVTEQRLSESDGLIGDAFGNAVAISADGTRVIVGVSIKTIGMNDSQGAAYVYSGTNYATEKKLVASDGAASNYFGGTVAMSGDGTKVIVGAYRKQVGANVQQGEAYVYSGTNYATEQRLTASDGAANDFFGSSVGMSADGTRVIVGAYNKTVGANAQQGAAYVFAAPPSLPNPAPSPRPGPAPSGHPAPLPRLRATVVPASGTPNPLPARRP